MHRHVFIFLFVGMVLILSGCATPYVQPSASIPAIPAIHGDFAVMDDGYRLPLTHWKAPAESQAIVLALHGLNDYRNSFESTGKYLARHGITVIAYDQRGFGTSDGHGLWHGSDRMIEDLHVMIDLLHGKFPDHPVYLLGESMGGAVVLAAMHDEPLDITGVILVAPAVWSRHRMPFYQRYLLWIVAHTWPALKLTGEGLDLQPSDNIDMLRALSRDPLVIKETRVDTLYGITNLMDQAVSSVNNLTNKTLILYGMHDDIIPRIPTCQWLLSLPSQYSHLRQILIYKNGYHMLTRDLQGDIVLEDIKNWIHSVDSQITELDDRITINSFCPAGSLSVVNREDQP